MLGLVYGPYVTLADFCVSCSFTDAVCYVAGGCAGLM
jgi:hypothetical protein